MSALRWLIVNPGAGYWSNADGWVDRATADRFGPSDRKLCRLPVGGRWIREHESADLAGRCSSCGELLTDHESAQQWCECERCRCG